MNIKISGIYQIQSIIKPERCYVGSAVNIGKRWNGHMSRLRRGIHHSIKLQNHYNKYGEDDLVLTILLGCREENLIKTEQYFLDSYRPFFNIYTIADRPTGIIPSEKTRQKMRDKRKGFKPSAESIEKARISNTGQKRSDEARKNMANAQKGKKQTKGQIEKRISCIRGKPSPLKGSHHTNETKIKISEGLLRISSDERKRKLSESHKGIKASPETRKKQSKSQKGHTVSEKTRKAVAEANRRRIITPETREKLREALRRRREEVKLLQTSLN